MTPTDLPAADPPPLPQTPRQRAAALRAALLADRGLDALHDREIDRRFGVSEGLTSRIRRQELGVRPDPAKQAGSRAACRSRGYSAGFPADGPTLFEPDRPPADPDRVPRRMAALVLAVRGPSPAAVVAGQLECDPAEADRLLSHGWFDRLADGAVWLTPAGRSALS